MSLTPQSIPFRRTLKQKPNKVGPATTAYEVSGAQDARQLLRKRQKPIKIPDKSKDGWQVVAEYETDELASGSEDEKRLEKARETASRKRRQKDQANIERGEKGEA